MMMWSTSASFDGGAGGARPAHDGSADAADIAPAACRNSRRVNALMGVCARRSGRASVALLELAAAAAGTGIVAADLRRIAARRHARRAQVEPIVADVDQRVDEVAGRFAAIRGEILDPVEERRIGARIGGQRLDRLREVVDRLGVVALEPRRIRCLDAVEVAEAPRLV